MPIMTTKSISTDPLKDPLQVLEIKNLVKKYGSLTAVNNLTLSIPTGLCYGLLGPNGAGKSTTIEIIEGLKKPTSGEIYYNQKPIDKNFKDIIGIQFQSTSLQDHLTVLEALKLFESFFKKTIPLDQIIETCQLNDFINQDTQKISGGQRQRALLAIALLNDPEILFLDEPTTGLDPQSRRHFWDLITHLKKDKKKTILLTTHYMEEAYILCDEIAIIDKGQIIAQGPPRKLLEKHYSGAHISLDKNILLPLDFPYETYTNYERIEFHTDNVRDSIKYLLSKNIDISSVEIKKQTLDDLFLDLTGKKTRN